MSCPEQRTIEDFVLGRLEPEELSDFEEHLRTCSVCLGRVDQAHENEKMLTELRALGEESTLTPSETVSETLTTNRVQALLGDRYRVVRKVGDGSAGQVFQAVDTVLERLVAVKFLPQKSGSAEPDAEAWREARLMSQLNHPNIAQMHEIGELEDRRFIVVEWVDGRPITEAWKDLHLEQRLRIYLGVLDAVDAAHSRGIIHRDLKPSNILVTSDLKPKVLDFGIALETSSLDSLETAVYRGTPAYSAPEQITRPVKVYPATDVFALGILLYQLLTNTLPFPQSSTDELFEAIRNEHPELPTAMAEETPIALQNICLRALEKEPEKRYASVQDLSDDISRYLRGERVWARPSFLTDQIQQEVFYHRQKLKVWRDNELITQKEHDKLEGIYDHITSSSDLSIIESRELSLSQVCLYLGGWIVVLGSFVLFYKSWEEIPINWRPIPAIAATMLMMALGGFLWRRAESRLSIGFFATANLLIPITVLLTLGQWEVLSPANYPWGTETISEGLSELDSYLVVGNVQLFFCFLCSLLFSAIILWITASSLFVLFGVIAFLATLSTCYVAAGMENWPADILFGRYLVPGIGLFALGAVVDRRRHFDYAWPLSVIGLVVLVASLSGIAISPNTLFGWFWVEPPFLDEIELHFLSFLCNGIIYIGLALVCTRLRTPLQRSLAQVLNWLGPLHVLASLRMLDHDDASLSEIRRLVYRFLLPIVSLGLVFGSVLRQMKSYFYSGLGGIAAAVHKFTVEHLDKFFAWPVSLIITGVVWMLISWLVPRLKERLILRADT